MLYVSKLAWFQPISDSETYLLSFIAGIVASYATSGSPLLSPVYGGIVGYLGSLGVNFHNYHENSYGCWVEYAEAGITFSFVGIGLWGETGLYSNQYEDSIYHQWHQTPWEYYAMTNLYTYEGAIYDESPHQSPWPPSPWNTPW